MVQGIREAFIANLPNLPWMDEETKQAATEKVRSLTCHCVRCLLVLY